MPNTYTNRYTNAVLVPAQDPLNAITDAVRLADSTTFVHGMLLGEVTATPGTYAPYLSSNSDGTQIAKCILKYDCITDASGNITEGGTTPSEFGQVDQTAEVYIAGTFRTDDLYQTAAAGQIVVAAVTTQVPPIGRLTEGTVVTGMLRIG